MEVELRPRHRLRRILAGSVPLRRVRPRRSLGLRTLAPDRLPSNPETELTDLVRRMATGSFDYDILTYDVLGRAYADNSYYGSSYGASYGYYDSWCCSGFSIGLSFGTPFYPYRPYYRPYHYGYYPAYSPFYYDPFFYDPFYYRPARTTTVTTGRIPATTPTTAMGAPIGEATQGPVTGRTPRTASAVTPSSPRATAGGRMATGAR